MEKNKRIAILDWLGANKKHRITYWYYYLKLKLFK